MPLDAEPTPPPTRATRAFEAVAERLREELASGRFPSGDRLPSERALAERLGVSRNTLREALRSLEHAGLIRLQKGASGGAFVTGSSGHSVATGLMDLYHFGGVLPTELTEAHLWLMAIVVREAAPRATAADLVELTANVDAAEASVDDYLQRVRTNLDFHRILARMTDNPVMVVVVNGVLDVVWRFLERVPAYPNQFVVPSRRRLLVHLRAGEAEAAVREMDRCLRDVRAMYLERIASPAPA